MNGYLLCFMLFSTLAYFLLIAKIAPLQSDRYVFSIYPVIILLFVTLFHHSLYRIDKTAAIVMPVAVSILVILLGFHDKPVSRLYQNTPDVPDIVQAYKDTSCIVVTSSSDAAYRIDNILFDLTQFDRTYICKTIDDFGPALDGIAKGQELFLYIYKDLDVGEVLADMKKELPYKTAILLYQSSAYGVYHIEW